MGPGTLRAVFFDAGYTLVYPDPVRTLAPLTAAGIAPTTEQLFSAERQARKRRDHATAAGRALADQHYWEIYYDALLEAMEQRDGRLRDELVAAARRSGNWEYLQPGTREALQIGRAHV